MALSKYAKERFTHYLCEQVIYAQGATSHLMMPRKNVENLFLTDPHNLPKNSEQLLVACTNYYFFYLQSLLTANANISKILNNTARGKELKRYFNIDVARIPNVMDRRMRNTSDHYDERIERIVKKLENESGNLVVDRTLKLNITWDENIRLRWLHLRYFDEETGEIKFVDENINTISMQVDTVAEEIEYLVETLKELNTIF